eukprot:308492_1
MLILALLLCAVVAEDNSSPLRDWQKGYFSGNPIYSPVGPFTNYSIMFRPNDGKSNPPNYLMIETGPQSLGTSPIAGSYQQWSIYGEHITYCGLLTQDNGKTYLMTRPEFVYQEQLSSEFEIYFCADPRGGGCDTFWWQWKYNNDTGKLLWKNRVGGYPHEETNFDFYPNIDTSKVAVDTAHRDVCTYIIAQQSPYDYTWVVNETTDSDPKWEMLNNENRKTYQKKKDRKS